MIPYSLDDTLFRKKLIVLNSNMNYFELVFNLNTKAMMCSIGKCTYLIKFKLHLLDLALRIAKLLLSIFLLMFYWYIRIPIGYRFA